jgi:type VI secretion system protein ImpE
MALSGINVIGLRNLRPARPRIGSDGSTSELLIAPASEFRSDEPESYPKLMPKREDPKDRCSTRNLKAENPVARTLQYPIEDHSGPVRRPDIDSPAKEGVMTAKDLMDAGQLGPAIARLGEDLRARPADRLARTFLFELLCFANDLDRAGRQLDVLGHQDGDPLGVQVYRSLLAAERSRSRLWAEGLRPRFVLDPPAAVELHLKALDLARLDRLVEAREALDRARTMMQAPLRGTVGETAFVEFRDADDILAPVLEVISSAGYFWVPWEHIQHLAVSTPRNLRELLWTPADLATFDGQLGQVFLPNLYPGTASHPDDLVRLGRTTLWQDLGAGIVRGAGPKVFLAGDETFTLPELGVVQFPPPEPSMTRGS